MKKLGWKIILVVAVVVTGVILAIPPVIQMRVVSPSHRKVAIVQVSRFNLFGRSRLYIAEAGEHGNKQFIGMVLNDRLDRIEGLIWSPDETELAIANNYDGSPSMVVIVDLRDAGGAVTIPARYGTLTKSGVRAVIQTRYSVRSVSPPDLKWLSPQLSGMQCEHGNFLDVVRMLLGLGAVKH